jgi:hypothetical protein
MYSHYRKRLKIYGFNEKDEQHVYRTTGKPCSCIGCSGEKYSRKQKHKNLMKENFEVL